MSDTLTDKQAVKTVYPSAEILFASGFGYFVSPGKDMGAPISGYFPTAAEAWAEARKRLAPTPEPDYKALTAERMAQEGRLQWAMMEGSHHCGNCGEAGDHEQDGWGRSWCRKPAEPLAPQEERQDGLTALIEDAWSRWTGAAIDVVHMQPEDYVHDELKSFLQRHFVLKAEPATPAPEQGLPKRPPVQIHRAIRDFHKDLFYFDKAEAESHWDALEARVRTLEAELEGKR